MGTTSSTPANARADLRRRAAGGPQYPTPPGFNGTPQNNGQVYGGFQPRQQFAAPQFYGQVRPRPAPTPGFHDARSPQPRPTPPPFHPVSLALSFIPP